MSDRSAGAGGDDEAGAPVPFREAAGVWLQVALRSFGGPAGQIAVMHRIVVEERRWVDEARFLHALNYCMLLPGPEAQQLATYLGWLLHGTRGGLVAGGLFVLPGFLAMLALSFVYVLLGDVSLVEGIFFGLKAAVLAIVVQAVHRLGRRVLANGALFAIGAAAFVAIFLFRVPFPAIVVGAALAGWAGGRWWPQRFRAVGPAPAGGNDAPAARAATARALPGPAAVARTVLLWSAVWMAPFPILAALGAPAVLHREAVFFSQAAVVTFGGAYAVLAYIAQQAVERHGWLLPGEMLDGLGLAETTPGPLILVVQFVGFLGAYRHPGELDPLLAGALGAVVTTWVTFAPCFLWIFAGAPYVETLRGNRRLTAALSAITAAVVGVILNLAVWFALNVLFAELRPVELAGLRLDVPVARSVDAAAVALTAAALVATFRFRMGMLRVIGACAGLGALIRLLGG